MHLSTVLDEGAVIHNTDAAKLYGSVVSEFRQARHDREGRLFFLKLWDSIAPTGNIYRHAALQAERLKHCDDLWCQVNALAAEAEAKGEMSKDKFIADFRATVQSAPSSVVPSGTEGERPLLSDPEKDMIGFMPLEEFLATPTRRFMGVIFPIDSREFRHKMYTVITSLLVMWLQITAPLLIMVNQYMMLPDRLKTLRGIWNSLSWAEVFCLGKDLQQSLHTLMGIALLLLLLLILSNYAGSELAGLQKSLYLPIDRSWILCGNVTNMWVTLCTGLAAPILFWNESTPTSMSMDALTLLWLFTLDDLSSYAYNIIMRSDEDFQRSVAWTKALLGQCPVRIADLRDKDGQWHFKVGPDGLLRPDGELCQTRYTQKCAHDEPQPSSSSDQYKIQVIVTPDSVEHLPHAEKVWIAGLWTVEVYLLSFMNIVMPIIWFVVDKPCFSKDM